MLNSLTTFGLRQLKITSQTGDVTAYLPAAQTLTVSPKVQTEEFYSEGVLIASAAIVTSVDWDLAHGGLSLAALAILTGVATVAAGTTPNQTLRLSLFNGAAFPYVVIYGRTTGDAGGDVVVRLARAKLQSLSGRFANGQFLITSCSGVAALDSTLSTLDLTQRETAAAF